MGITHLTRGTTCSLRNELNEALVPLAKKHNLDIDIGDCSISPDKYEWIAEILEMDKGEWFHYMQSTIYINKNTPIGYYRDFFPGTKSKFILRGKL